jgi:hypothetical protein
MDENRKLALATSGLRLVYTAILGMAIFNFFLILNVLKGTDLVPLEEISQKVMLYLKSFENTWTFGLIVFGFHLLVLGILVLKTRNIHRFWGILLTFAGVSYILISSSKLIFPDLESPIKTVEMVLSLPMAFGEIGFAVWLIIRGGKPKTVFRSELTI